MLGRKQEKLDVKRLNELIRLSRNVLNIIFFLIILLLVFLGSFLFKEWKIGVFILTLLKVLSPFFIGLIVAWLFDPLVTKLNKKGVSRVLGTIIVYLILIVFVVLLISLLLPALSGQINDFVSSIPSIITSCKEVIDNFFTKLSTNINYDLDATKMQLFQSIEQIGLDLATNLPDIVVGLIKSIINGGVNILLGFMLGFYMLFDFNNVQKHLMVILPKNWHKDAKDLSKKINGSLRDFVQGTFFIMFILFVVQSIGLTLAGLKAPMLFGLFCAITNVIPYLGPYIGGIPAILVGFSQSPVVGIFTLIAVVAAQLLESYFLQPIVMGKAMKLHPVTIMVSLLIFGHFFGIFGMILATPIVAVLKIIVSFANSKIDLLYLLRKEHQEELQTE